MDFITHSLVGAGVARLACPKREWLPQLTLAGLLGSLVMDGDSWLYLLGPNAYGLYHRVLSHNVFALTLIAVFSMALAGLAEYFKKMRRFGWFVSPNLPASQSLPTRVTWRRLFVVAAMAAALHWTYDVITGFGNMKPFWPLSQYEISFRAINSFDYYLMGFTLAWHLTIRQLDWPRRREVWITLAYFLTVAAYVLGRMAWSQPAFI